MTLKDDFIMSLHSNKLNKIQLLYLSSEIGDAEYFVILKKIFKHLMRKFDDAPACLEIIAAENAVSE